MFGGKTGPRSPAGFRSATALVNGTSLHYVIGGRGSPVAFLHGFPETWAAWREVMVSLAPSRTVVGVDLRGAGESRLEKGVYDKETLATDVYRLVEHLGLRDVTLVGDDFGGQVAYAYARMHRGELRCLVAVETALPGFGLESLFSGSTTSSSTWSPTCPSS